MLLDPFIFLFFCQFIHYLNSKGKLYSFCGIVSSNSFNEFTFFIAFFILQLLDTLLLFCLLRLPAVICLTSL